VALHSVEHLTKRFGGIVAVDDVSLALEQGQIAGLIGPNGAGKTTLFNLITRLYRPDSGEVAFAGQSLLRTPAYRVVRRGIARTFQNVELFPSMTVRENVEVGSHARGDQPAHELLAELGLESVAGPSDGRAAVRDDEAGRACPGPRLRAAPAAARRARRRPQP
jgi:ABC-type branched-subunit amino acid transport system ATPase component